MNGATILSFLYPPVRKNVYNGLCNPSLCWLVPWRNRLQVNFSSVFLLGLRGSITLLNKRNYAAEFSWSPVLDERGTAFSIRPSIGKLATHTYLPIHKKGPGIYMHAPLLLVLKWIGFVMTFWRLIVKTSKCRTYFDQHSNGLFRGAFSLVVESPLAGI